MWLLKSRFLGIPRWFSGQDLCFHCKDHGFSLCFQNEDLTCHKVWPPLTKNSGFSLGKKIPNYVWWWWLPLTVVIISQYTPISNHYVVHLQLIWCSISILKSGFLTVQIPIGFCTTQRQYQASSKGSLETPRGPLVMTGHFHCCAQVQFLVGELRFHKPSGVTKNKVNGQ